MDIILQRNLFDDFPELYSQHKLSPMKTCMCWGVETGDGWYNLIYRLSSDLVAISKDIRATQVKEKFGSLRFYWVADGKLPDRKYIQINNRINQAEDESCETCEECGSKDNVTQTDGWIYTLCDKCLAEKFKTKVCDTIA